jgi:hypothetical protein
MENELAQELEKAGYLQPDVEDELEYEGSFRSTTDGDVYIPTLSELIEVCGDNFYKLEASVENAPVDDVVTYIVNDHYLFRGNTPEIAVAKLYLAIHSQSVDQQTD